MNASPDESQIDLSNKKKKQTFDSADGYPEEGCILDMTVAVLQAIGY